MKTFIDHALNVIAILAVAALLFMVGWVFGRNSGLNKISQDIASSNAQTMRNLAKYPLGRPRLVINTLSGITAVCER